MLRDGRADVALLHRPFDSTVEFDIEELAAERQVAVLPAGHRLSGRPQLRLADVSELRDLPQPRWPRSDGSYPDGPGPQVRSPEQLLQLIGPGRTMAVLPESVGGQLRDGHAVVPLVEAPQVTTVVAWPPHTTLLALASLIPPPSASDRSRPGALLTGGRRR